MMATPELISAPEESDWTQEQRDAFREIAAGPRGALIGPFAPLLHSPGLLQPLQRTGEYIRWHSHISERLREMVILMVARHWDQGFEWTYHHPIAQKCGLSEETITAIAEDRRPTDLNGAGSCVWALTREVLSDGTASDSTVTEALRVLGAQDVIEYVATVGYYSTLAFVMNVARTSVPDGPVLPPRQEHR
jgi:4-carboxymuconolactone decarboxylase